MPNRRRQQPPPPRAAQADAPKPRPKSTVLVIRISPEDRALVEEVATANELETSTWARQQVVLAAKRWRAQHGATPPPDDAG